MHSRVIVVALLFGWMVICQPQESQFYSQAFPTIASGFAIVVASSEWDANHGPGHIRLDYNTKEGASSWSAAVNDSNQWVIVNFGLKPVRVTRLVTQGRGNYDQWVTSFKVQYSQDGIYFSDVDNGRTFAGNYDRNTKVTSFFNQIVFARLIKIIPVTFNGHMSMRLEVFINNLNNFKF